MKKRLLLCLCLLFGCFVYLTAQNKSRNVDSLVNVVETQDLTVDEKLTIYERICQISYDDYKPDEIIAYAEKGIQLAGKNKKNLWVSVFYEFMGLGYEDRRSLDTALMYYQKAHDKAIEANDKKLELSALLSISAFYGNQNKLTEALEYSLLALPLSEQINDRVKQTAIMGNIGSIYYYHHNYKRALYYFEGVETIAEEMNDYYGKRKAYYQLGQIWKDSLQYDKALDYAEKGLELVREKQDKTYEVLNLELLAQIYYLKEPRELEKAEEYALEGLRICNELGSGSVRLSIPAWNTLASVYSHQKRYKESEEAALKVLEIDSTNLDMAMNANINLAIASFYLNRPGKAENYLRKYIDLKNQSTNKSTQELLLNMEMKYEGEKKQARIAVLEKEKQYFIWMGIAAAIVVLMVLVLLFIRHRMNVQKRKIAEQKREIAEQRNELAEQQIKQLEQEKQLIATQAVLDGETAERTRLARDLHDGLGGMLSVVKLNLKDMKNYSILDASDTERFGKALEMLDGSITELRRVAHHMMPESLMRNGLKISLEDFCRAIPNAHFLYFGSDRRLDDRLEVVLYRCAYELVNNALKYSEAQTINVQLVIDKGLVSLTVQDDGKGFDVSKITGGSGLANIRARVSAYNGRMTILSSADSGTEISIEIEFK